MSQPGFWDNQETAQDVGRKRSRIEKRIATAESLESKAADLGVLLEFQEAGENVDADIETLVAQLEKEITETELTMKLSG
ncbi:MAG TPA: PCRF domain-containing protein, partial [Thermoanaerobaculia bacterium]